MPITKLTTSGDQLLFLIKFLGNEMQYVGYCNVAPRRIFGSRKTEVFGNYLKSIKKDYDNFNSLCIFATDLRI